jgi:hypothetical protein
VTNRKSRRAVSHWTSLSAAAATARRWGWSLFIYSACCCSGSLSIRPPPWSSLPSRQYALDLFISGWELACICLAWPVTCTCMQFRCRCCCTQTQLQRCEHKLNNAKLRACLPPIIYPPPKTLNHRPLFFQLLQPCGCHTTVRCGEACNYWANMHCW